MGGYFYGEPLDVIEWAVPFTRPPDIPNERGIGLPEQASHVSGKSFHASDMSPHSCLASTTEELDMHFPNIGTMAGNTDIW